MTLDGWLSKLPRRKTFCEDFVLFWPYVVVRLTFWCYKNKLLANTNEKKNTFSATNATTLKTHSIWKTEIQSLWWCAYVTYKITWLETVGPQTSLQSKNKLARNTLAAKLWRSSVRSSLVLRSRLVVRPVWEVCLGVGDASERCEADDADVTCERKKEIKIEECIRPSVTRCWNEKRLTCFHELPKKEPGKLLLRNIVFRKAQN